MPTRNRSHFFLILYIETLTVRAFILKIISCQCDQFVGNKGKKKTQGTALQRWWTGLKMQLIFQNMYISICINKKQWQCVSPVCVGCNPILKKVEVSDSKANLFEKQRMGRWEGQGTRKMINFSNLASKLLLTWMTKYWLCVCLSRP